MALPKCSTGFRVLSLGEFMRLVYGCQQGLATLLIGLYMPDPSFYGC